MNVVGVVVYVQSFVVLFGTKVPLQSRADCTFFLFWIGVEQPYDRFDLVFIV